MKQAVGIPQEGLKVLACVSMLIDHIGCVFFPQAYWMRAIGRMAFPIYCMLLAEGVHFTHSPKQYLFRLLIGAILSELPFDFAFKGRIYTVSQSVMVTMLLGAFALTAVKFSGSVWPGLVVCAACTALAEIMDTDYGGLGVMLILLFGLTRELPHARLLQLAGMAVICWAMNSFRITLLGMRIPIEMFALPAMIPISAYSGQKLTRSRTVQAAFYLFYPVHLSIIAALR